MGAQPGAVTPQDSQSVITAVTTADRATGGFLCMFLTLGESKKFQEFSMKNNAASSSRDTQ